MRIYLDIETLPGQQPEARELARQGVKPPGNYKKPESIAEWWKNEGEAAVEDAYRRQALDGAAGELCALGFASDESEPVSLVRERQEAEADFLRRALAELQALIATSSFIGGDGATWPAEPFYIAHNAGFDLGFLMRRCWVHGVRPPPRLPLPSERAGRHFGCTMETWAGTRGTIGLDRLCRALGVASPKADGIDGSQVLDLWLAGERDKLAIYNAADVRAVRSCWQRLSFEEVKAA